MWNAILNPYLLIILIVLSGPGSARTSTLSESSQKQRVAIIFNGGKSEKKNSEYYAFKTNEEEAVKFYGKASFDKIIVLSDSQLSSDRRPTAQNLKKILTSLKNTEEVHLQFIAHGTGTPMPSVGTAATVDQLDPVLKLDPARFPSVRLSPAESLLLRQTNGSGASDTSTYSRFMIWTAENPNGTVIPHGNVGIGDLVNGVREAQKNNPGLTTTLYANSCFFGSVGRAFAAVRGTQVFSSSQASLEAYGLQQQQKWKSDSDNVEKTNVEEIGVDTTDYSRLFQRYLRDGKTYLEAHDEALRAYFDLVGKNLSSDESVDDTLGATAPRSSLQEFIKMWCVYKADMGSGKRSRSTKCRQTTLLDPVKKTNAIVMEFQQSNSTAQNCRKFANLIEGLAARRNRIVKKAADWLTVQLNKELDVASVTSRVEAIQREMMVTYKIGEDSLVNDVQTQMNAFKSMDAKQRRDLLESRRQAEAKVCDSIIKVCVEKKVVDDYIYGCNGDRLVQTFFAPAAYVWGHLSGPEIKRHKEEIRDACKPNRRLPYEEQVSASLECYESQAEKDPIATLDLANEIDFGEACALVQSAVLVSQEDQNCVNQFENNANCDDWKELAERVKLGSRHLDFPADPPTDMRSAEESQMVQ